MKIKKYIWRGTKCDYMATGAICFIMYAVYAMASRLIESFENGNITYRYHSNLFYGNEAIVMYVIFFIILIFISLSFYIGIKKCYKKLENGNKYTN